MKKDTKKILKAALLTGLGFLLVTLLLMLLKFGWQDLFSANNKVLLFFLPLWTLMMTFVGYGVAKGVVKNRRIILGDNPDNTTEERRLEWRNWIIFNISKYCKMAAAIIAVSVPVYYIDYLYGGEFLNGSGVFIIGLVLTAVFLYIIGVYLSKKINTESN